MKKDTKNVVNFLFETGILSKTPRSGFHFLGSGKQTVAEHSNRAVFIGYVLGMLSPNVNVDKVMKMCLFHDLAEGRTSDLNYVHQKYVESNELKAIDDLARSVPFGEDILKLLKEFQIRKSKESLLAKDADQLEWLLSLKEQYDIGNKRSMSWMKVAYKRLKTPLAKKLARVILKTDSNNWWFTGTRDEWWINRNKQNGKNRF